MNLSPACNDTSRADAFLRTPQLRRSARVPVRHTLIGSLVAGALGASTCLHADTSADTHAEAEKYAPDRESTEQLGNLEVIDGLLVFEGDMILGDADKVDKTSITQRGFGHNRNLERWPNGVVPYGFDAGISDEQRDSIAAAIEQYHEQTRIKFVAAPDDSDYDTRLVFRPMGGCASYVGRTDLADQDLFVENCSVGSIVHELAHAIGLYHEHTRRDRDNYITVNWDEVIAGKERNFEILTANVQEYGDYDYGSIMHYGEYFFSRSGERTIQAPDGIKIGQRDGLSGLDIATINRMYATDLDLSVNPASRKLQAEDGSEFDALTVDIAVTNVGALGAHSLDLEVSLADDTEWLTISQNSGWDCTISAAILSCQSGILQSGETTRFELTVNPGSGSIDDLDATLTSITQDLDASNNVYNDGVDTEAEAPEAPQEPMAETATGDQSDGGEDARQTSTETAANTGANSGSGSTDPALGAAKGSGGGGASGPMFMLLAGAGVVLRRRHGTRCVRA